jgi:outer membrane protein
MPIRMQKLVSDTKALHENGFVEYLDLQRVVVANNNIVSEQKMMRRLTDLSMDVLKFQMGMNRDNQIEISGSVELKNLSDGLLNETENPAGRIEYELLKSQKQFSSFNYKNERFSVLPSVSGFGVLNTQAQRNEFNFFDPSGKWYPMSLVGFRVSIPVMDGFQRHNRAQKARLELLKIDNNLDLFNKSYQLELKSAKAALANGLDVLNHQKENMNLALEIYNLTKIKYEQGVGSNLELISAETSLKAAEAAYFAALFEAYGASVDLKKALGKLDNGTN